MINVTIVSPNHSMRVGLREMLSGQREIRVIGDATDLQNIDERETEVLVLASVSSAFLADLNTDSFGLLLLTDDLEQARALLDLNARTWGVVSAGAGVDEVVAAVHAVGEGLWVGGPGLVKTLMRPQRRGDGPGEELVIESLTPREKEVLQLMAEGLANKQIAMRLSISEHTVKFHLSSLYGKLGVASRTEAVKRGLGLGLISL
ncbi:MAG: response regulator transcription factor [Anaerolineales bacterium]|nr:response regulator transcription factor [Anaerolineales bacterium]